jgi:hypothetical protein
MEMHRNRLTIVIAIAAFALLAGCEQEPAPPQEKPQLSGGSAASQPSSTELAALRSFVRGDRQPEASGLPAGHPPIPRASPAPMRSPAPTAGVELKFSAPADWKPTPPISNMRKAQYELPRSEGDSENGELVVYYFGPGEGGSVADNLARWRGQMTQADGSPLPDDAAREDHFDANGLKIAFLDVSGRYAPGAMPGLPDVGPRDNYRMFAAVIQTSAGPWFVKATGPGRTMEQQREAVRTFLSSAKP